MFTMRPLHVFALITCSWFLIIQTDAQLGAISCFQKVVMESFVPCLGKQTAKDSIGSKITEFLGIDERPKECESVTTTCVSKIMKKFGECYSAGNQEESRFNIMEGAINAGTTYLCKDNGKANEELQQDETCKTGKLSCMSSLFFNPPTFDAEGCKKLRTHFEDCKTKSGCQGKNANTYEEYLNIVLDSTPCKSLTTTTAPSPTPLVDIKKFISGLGSGAEKLAGGVTSFPFLSSALDFLNRGR